MQLTDDVVAHVAMHVLESSEKYVRNVAIPDSAPESVHAIVPHKSVRIFATSTLAAVADDTFCFGAVHTSSCLVKHRLLPPCVEFA